MGRSTYKAWRASRTRSSRKSCGTSSSTRSAPSS
ncbi:Uncharacterised protein [Bordetella pertussis]|nr:Uncharacterised protein [Bordetella pertussis]